MNYNPYCDCCEDNRSTHDLAMRQWKEERGKRIALEKQLEEQAPELERLKREVAERNFILEGYGRSISQQDQNEHVYFTLVQWLQNHHVGAVLVQEWMDANNEGRDVRSTYITNLEATAKKQKKQLELTKALNFVLMMRLKQAGIAIPREAVVGDNREKMEEVKGGGK